MQSNLYRLDKLHHASRPLQEFPLATEIPMAYVKQTTRNLAVCFLGQHTREAKVGKWLLNMAFVS